jgi:hypothetical protein
MQEPLVTKVVQALASASGEGSAKYRSFLEGLHFCSHIWRGRIARSSARHSKCREAQVSEGSNPSPSARDKAPSPKAGFCVELRELDEKPSHNVGGSLRSEGKDTK